MKKIALIAFVLIFEFGIKAQTNPAITSWLQNSTVTGRHYVSGNSTAINDADLVNVQSVQYSSTYSYISATGVPAYVTGPFLDGNPSLTTAQNSIFKVTLNPTKNTGTPTSTTMGNIGVFINGVAVFDSRDGVSWNNSTSTLCGGPGNSPCPGGPTATMDWNRDAVPAEQAGFDCNKGHPAMGNYHHHQNPSAFKLDKVVLSNICNTYDADGLYAIDSTVHSPLIGFAYDGFPIYGAYAYADTNGTGGIVRMKSGYALTGASTRTNGPAISSTYFDGYFNEDYVYTAHPNQTDYLDEHNGRWCKTPEYPNGTYCYFTTVDDNWNSAYPYMVGPTFYGNVDVTTVTSVPAGTTTYNSPTSINEIKFNEVEINIYPNPASDYLVLQVNTLVKENINVEMYDIAGKFIKQTTVYQGSTIANIDVRSVYDGQYILKIISGNQSIAKRVIIARD